MPRATFHAWQAITDVPAFDAKGSVGKRTDDLAPAIWISQQRGSGPVEWTEPAYLISRGPKGHKT